MRFNYELVFETKRGSFRLKVSLKKSHGERLSLKTGYKGQPVKWIKVVPKDPELSKIVNPDEIERVVEQDELESLWPTGEEKAGRPAYVVVDRKMLNKAFPSDGTMRVLRTVPLKSVHPHLLEDSHYFLNIYRAKQGRVRVTNPDDEMMYSLVRAGLLENKEGFIVHYNGSKFGLVYATKTGLHLTNILGTNHQKKRDEAQPEQKVDLRMYERLVDGTRHKHVGECPDRYGEKLEELVQAAMRGEAVPSPREVKPAVYSRLAALAESDDEEERPKSKGRKGR